MKVAELPYKRIDLKRAAAFLEDAAARFAADGFDGQKRVYAAASKKRDNVETMFRLAELRFFCNTKDEFYIKERGYYDEFLPAYEAAETVFFRAVLNSSCAEFRASLPAVVIHKYETSVKCMSPEIIADKQEENRLITEYNRIINGGIIPFRDKKIPFAELKSFFTDGDRKTRAAAYGAAGKFLKENSAEFDSIFDSLVKVRNRMARKLGCKNFIELGYYRMNRSFDVRDIESFRANVLSDIVPAVSKLRKIQRADLGLRSLMLYDFQNYFISSEPKPIGTVEEIFAAGKAMYEEMSPVTAEFINFMLDTDAFDVLTREGKWGGGMCTYVPDFKQPFILANFNGSADDVDVLTHEAGHALAAYCARNAKYRETREGGMETCEIHSMAMEFFAWKYMERFFGSRAADYRYRHAADSLSFLPYGTMVDHFQHIMYENEDLTPAQRKSEWLRLESIYRPDLKMKGIPYLEEGGRWQYQMHIYELPFYYIDYCLAQSVALQFLLASVKDYDKAFKRYFKLLKAAGSKPFAELVSDAKLKNPLAEGALKKIASDSLKLIKNIRV